MSTRPPVVAATPTAVLFATAPTDDGRPAAALRWDERTTLVERLAGQLRSLGVTDVHVLVRPGVELGPTLPAHVCEDAAADLRYVAELNSTGPLILAAGEVVTQREALAGLLADPRVQTGILTTSGKVARPWGYRTKIRRGRLISASSPFHTTADPNQTFLEVIKVAPADRPRLAGLAARLAALRAAPPEEWSTELEFRKAGTWKLSQDRAHKAAIAREERLALEAAVAAGTVHPQQVEAAIDPEKETDPEAPDEAPEALEREDPESVTLEPEYAAELHRRMAAAREEVPALLLTALVRDGAQVGNSFLRSLFWARPLSADAVERARISILSHDEEAELLRSAVKASDGFFTTFFVSPFSKYAARAAARAGFSPNGVTVFSMLLGVVAAVLFATGERWGLITGGVVAYFAFFFDCVDGQLARYARRFSKLGAWLDSIFDRSKEYVIFAGLAYGAHRMGYEPAWVLACAAITLQTTRHAVDFSWPTTQHAVIETLEHQPLAVPGDAFGHNLPLWLRPLPPPKEERPEAPPPSLPQRAWKLWRRVGRVKGVKWVKKMITFPIGERFAVIAIVTASSTPKTTLIVLLAWGGFAAAYITLGRLVRVARTVAQVPVAAVRGRLESYRDDGPIVLPPFTSVAPLALLAPALIILGGAIVVGEGRSNAVAPVLLAVLFGAASSGTVATDRLRWLVPPVLRVIEFAAIAWMARLGGHAEAGFAFLAAVCFRHYDLVYRLRHRGTESERLVSVLGLGWGGRMLLVLVLLLTGAIPVGLYIAAGLLALLWVGDAVRAWTGAAGRARRPADDVEADEEEEAG